MGILAGSILAGDGGLFGPSGLTPTGPACAVRLRVAQTSNLLSVLILHPGSFVVTVKKSPHSVGFDMLLAGDGGFEPPHTESESGVLPLDESPVAGS